MHSHPHAPCPWNKFVETLNISTMSLKKAHYLLTALLISSFSFSQNANNLLNFDGIDDYVDLNSLQQTVFNNRDQFTIEFWMRGLAADQSSSIRTAMFAINEPTGENRFHMILGGPANQDGKLMVYGDGGAGAGSLYTSSQDIGDGVCHHLAYSFDGSIGRVYIDGLLVNSHQTTYGITVNDRYSLGQEYDALATSQFYKGDLDEIRIWGTVRTLTEIQGNMNLELTGSESGLLAYYNCNQGIPGGVNTTVTTLDDITVANLDGTLNDFALNGPESNWVLKQCDSDSTNTLNEFSVNMVNIYPNPTNGFCTIDGNDLTVSSIQVFNLLGEKTDQIATTTLPTTIDFSKQTPGVYFVKVLSKEGEFTTRVILK